jgi:hypothetical protein
MSTWNTMSVTVAFGGIPAIISVIRRGIEKKRISIIETTARVANELHLRIWYAIRLIFNNYKVILLWICNIYKTV